MSTAAPRSEASSLASPADVSVVNVMSAAEGTSVRQSSLASSPRIKRTISLPHAVNAAKRTLRRMDVRLQPVAEPSRVHGRRNRKSRCGWFWVGELPCVPRPDEQADRLGNCLASARKLQPLLCCALRSFTETAA